MTLKNYSDTLKHFKDVKHELRRVFGVVPSSVPRLGGDMGYLMRDTFFDGWL